MLQFTTVKKLTISVKSLGSFLFISQHILLVISLRFLASPSFNEFFNLRFEPNWDFFLLAEAKASNSWRSDCRFWWGNSLPWMDFIILQNSTPSILLLVVSSLTQHFSLKIDRIIEFFRIYLRSIKNSQNFHISGLAHWTFVKCLLKNWATIFA